MDTETKTYKLSELYPDVAAKAAQRMHIKKDDIPLVRKYFVADKDSVQVDVQERSIVSRISCSNTDRDGESLLPSGVLLENYKRNPIVCWSHVYNSPEQIVGKNIWIKSDEKGLIAKTAFANNEFADQVYRAYTEDIGGTGPLLRGWSVGFIPIEYETPTKQTNGGPRRVYTKWELLEYSAVAIPCSPESLTLAYEKGVITSASLKKDFDPAPAPDADPPADAVEEVKAVEPEVKAEDVPVAEPDAPINTGKLTVTIDADTAAFEAKLADLQARVDKLHADIEAIEARATPAPLAEVPASHPLPIDDFIDIEPSGDIFDIEPSVDILTLEPSAPKPAPAPKALTPGDVEGAIVTAIDAMDIKGVIDKSVKLTLDKLRGRVR